MRPQEGEIWQHQKHDEAAGKFHQYVIICIAEPGECPYEESPVYFNCNHTETGYFHSVLPAEGDPNAPPGDTRSWLFPPLDVPCVIYQNTVPEMDGGKVWGRPLEDFCGEREGRPRFTRIK